MEIRKLTACCLWLTLTFAGASVVLAWSSKSYPLFSPVHQLAITAVLSNQVTTVQLQILQDQQLAVDNDQQSFQSYEHAMTGLTNASDTVTRETTNYISLSEQFIRSNLLAAIAAKATNAESLAFTNLGRAIHPLEDATSPAHEPFQTWSYKEGWWSMAVHVSKERVYPNNAGDPAEVAERKNLEGVVQYAYDIYSGTNTMPDHFFNPTNGGLLLPARYQNGRAK